MTGTTGTRATATVQFTLLEGGNGVFAVFAGNPREPRGGGLRRERVRRVGDRHLVRTAGGVGGRRALERAPRHHRRLHHPDPGAPTPGGPGRCSTARSWSSGSTSRSAWTPARTSPSSATSSCGAAYAYVGVSAQQVGIMGGKAAIAMEGMEDPVGLRGHRPRALRIAPPPRRRVQLRHLQPDRPHAPRTGLAPRRPRPRAVHRRRPVAVGLPHGDLRQRRAPRRPTCSTASTSTAGAGRRPRSAKAARSRGALRARRCRSAPTSARRCSSSRPRATWSLRSATPRPAKPDDAHIRLLGDGRYRARRPLHRRRRDGRPDSFAQADQRRPRGLPPRQRAAPAHPVGRRRRTPGGRAADRDRGGRFESCATSTAIALGGIRTPVVDVPAATLSGDPVGDEIMFQLFGSTTTFSPPSCASSTAIATPTSPRSTPPSIAPSPRGGCCPRTATRWRPRPAPSTSPDSVAAAARGRFGFR